MAFLVSTDLRNKPFSPEPQVCWDLWVKKFFKFFIPELLWVRINNFLFFRTWVTSLFLAELMPALPTVSLRPWLSSIMKLWGIEDLRINSSSQSYLCVCVLVHGRYKIISAWLCQTLPCMNCGEQRYWQVVNMVQSIQSDSSYNKFIQHICTYPHS